MPKMPKVKYVATIHFESDDKTDPKWVLETACDRMAEHYSVDVTDSHYEEQPDDPTTPSET